MCLVVFLHSCTFLFSLLDHERCMPKICAVSLAKLQVQRRFSQVYSVTDISTKVSRRGAPLNHLSSSSQLSHFLFASFSAAAAVSSSASSPSLLESSSPRSSSSSSSDVQLIRIGLRGSKSNYSLLLFGKEAQDKRRTRAKDTQGAT